MTSDASKDQNDVSTLLGVSNADGSTPVKIWASPSTHRLLVDSSGGGGVPGSPVNSIQYNNAGSFGGSGTLLFNGTDTVTAGAEGGTFNVLGTDATTNNTAGASLDFQGGVGLGSGAGGSVVVRAGSPGTTGDGGAASLIAHDGGSGGGAGGDVTVTGGNAQAGNSSGGRVLLQPGAKSGSGTTGHVFISDASSGRAAELDTSSLTADRTYTFPDASGTFLLSTSAQYQSATYVVSTTVGQGDYTDIQSAIDALPSGGGLIFVRAGTYTLAASINIKVANTQLQGEGVASIIQFNQASVTTAVKFNANDLERCAFRGFSVIQTNGSEATSVGISCGNQPFFQVDDVLVDNCNSGIDINDTANLSFYSTYSNLEITNCNACIQLRGNPVNDNTFSQIRTLANDSGIGLDLQKGNGNVFINFDAEPNSTTGTIGIQIANSTSNYSNTFIGTFAEGNATGLSILGSNAAGNIFIGGEFTGNTADISDSGTDTFFQNVAVTVGQRGVQVNNETPSGTINGSNVTFTLAHTPAPAASLQLYLNGAMQTAGGVDYSLSGATITFVSAPLTSSVLRAFYRY